VVKRRVALANQLRSLLESFWAGAAIVFANVDLAIAISDPSRTGRREGATRW